MDPVDLLQVIGLTKYEAEAYTALLREGPLTGYELGKRSPVPLPRIYDVVKRLVERGLALSQPDETPRYRAADPELFLEGVRSSTEETLNQLGRLLAGLSREDEAEDLWVIRTRAGILAHAASLIRAARHSAELVVRGSPTGEVEELAELVHTTDKGQPYLTQDRQGMPEQLALVIDDRQALLGTLGPAERCQAVMGAHPALVAAVRAYTRQERRPVSISPAFAPTPLDVRRPEWLAWEEEKQRRLLRPRHNVA